MDDEMESNGVGDKFNSIFIQRRGDFSEKVGLGFELLGWVATPIIHHFFLLIIASSFLFFFAFGQYILHSSGFIRFFVFLIFFNWLGLLDHKVQVWYVLHRVLLQCGRTTQNSTTPSFHSVFQSLSYLPFQLLSSPRMKLHSIHFKWLTLNWFILSRLPN